MTKVKFNLLRCAWFLVILIAEIFGQDCGDPGVIANGEFAGSTLFGNDAEIVCWDGYTGGGPITCAADNTWDTLPTCSPVDCGSPTIPNGFLDGDTTFNGTALVICNTGYQGGGEALCLPSGDWDQLFPSCDPVDCFDPDIGDGWLSPDSDTFYNGSATVECDAGFEVTGTTIAICLSDGNWDTLPTCDPKDCGVSPIPHSSLTIDSSTLYGGIAEVVCDAGYQGYGFATCLTTGQWDIDTLPSCSPIDCGTPFVLHGSLNGSTDTFYDGNTIIVCDPGYESGGAATCLDTGVWDELTLPTCDPVDCGSSVDPYGALSGDSFFAGTSSVVCNTGYTGGGLIVCQETGVWDSSSATPCTLVDCGSPDDPNGILVGDSTYGGTANISCNMGFVGGGPVTCLPSGDWDKTQAPSCILADCGPLAAPTYGDVSVTTTTYSSSAFFACGPLYQLNGNPVLTCGADENWSSDPPTCDDIDCPVLTAPVQGSLSSNEVTVGTTTFVYCVPGYSLFGLSPLTCMTGGTWDDVVGVCRIDCSDLVKPTYGSLNTTEVKEGTVVEVTCDKGYTMFGDAILECLPGGTWNTTVPDCVRECGPLDDPRHGLVSQPNGTTLNDVSTYTCDTGYYLSHTDTRVCQADGYWSNTLAVCIIFDCHEVLAPDNGSVNYPNGTTYNQMVQYSCDIGYDLIGPEIRTCLSDGTWNFTDPYCLIRDCGNLTSPTDGNVDTSEGTTYLSVAVFSCNIGYTMTGPATRTCEASALWSESSPVCNINDCGMLSDPTDGFVNYTETTYASNATYSCVIGYYLSGVSTRMCQADSTWSGNEPACYIKDCGIIDVPNDGNVTYSNSATTYDEIATFSCNPGFSLIGDVNRNCLNDGTWGGASPVCEIKDCGPLTDPENGVVDTSGGTTYMQTANYTCNIGYSMTGVNQTVCTADGVWSDSAPSCQIKDCGNVSDPADGFVSVTFTTFGETAVYTCKSGYYILGVQNRTCREDGIWSSTAPACARKDCGDPPVIADGNFTIPTDTKFGDRAVYFCDVDYGLIGSASVYCLDTGEWDTTPFCSKDCGSPPQIENGYFFTPNFTLMGAIVTYACDPGYEMVRIENITCHAEGIWSRPPGCKVVPKAYYDICEVTDQCVTQKATCRSEDGVLRCLCSTTGQVYDASVDSCLIDCGPLSDPLHGKVALPTLTSEGQVAVYSCDLNYALDLFDQTLAIRTCLSTGQWSGTAPECTEGCQPPVPPTNGYVYAPNGYARAYKIYYNCTSGYALQGEADRDCLATLFPGGEEYWLWGGNDPVCLLECPDLPDIENGNVDLSKGKTVGSIATYVCENNYALIGKPVRKCLSTGRWRGVEPICVIAIFPDILMAIGAVMIFLVILDILAILFCAYQKFFKKQNKKPEHTPLAEDEEDNSSDSFQPGIARASFKTSGPARSSFRKYTEDTTNEHQTNDLGENDNEHAMPKLEQARSTLPRPPKQEDTHGYEDQMFSFESPYLSEQKFGYPYQNEKGMLENDFDRFLQKEFENENFSGNEAFDREMDEDDVSIDLPPTNRTKDEMTGLKMSKSRKNRTDKRPTTKRQDASTLFKGRMSLPMGSVGRTNADGERFYTDEARRYLRETVETYETYTPVATNLQQPKT